MSNTFMGKIYDFNYTGCMTINSCFDKSNEVDTSDFIISFPFSKLAIKKDVSCHGKCWLFHLDEKC